jgi:Leucine-rich repeat (LRR) protein
LSEYICCNLELDELYIADSVEFIYCNNNNLKELDLPSSLECIEANYNRIKKITVRNNLDNLNKLHILKNKIKFLDFDPPPQLCDLEVDPFVQVPESFHDIININTEKLFNQF